MIAKWAQEDVETLDNLLKNNNNNDSSFWSREFSYVVLEKDGEDPLH